MERLLGLYLYLYLCLFSGMDLLVDVLGTSCFSPSKGRGISLKIKIMSSSFLFLDYQKKLKSSIWYEKDNLRILYYVIVCCLTCCVDDQTKRNVSKGLYPVPQDCGESGPSSFQLKKSHQPQLQSAHLLSSERFNLKLDLFGVYKFFFKDDNSILCVFAN